MCEVIMYFYLYLILQWITIISKLVVSTKIFLTQGGASLQRYVSKHAETFPAPQNIPFLPAWKPGLRPGFSKTGNGEI